MTATMIRLIHRQPSEVEGKTTDRTHSAGCRRDVDVACVLADRGAPHRKAERNDGQDSGAEAGL